MFSGNTIPLLSRLFLVAALCCMTGAWAQQGQESEGASAGITEMSAVNVSGIRSSAYRPSGTTSATLTNAPLEEVPVTVDVVTKELMESRDTATMDDVLKFESGVFQGGLTLYQRTPGQYSLRGMSGSEVQVDGLPLPAGMGVVLDSTMLERVEFVKGPVGSVTGGQTSTMGAYGAGGSVNLVLKEPVWENFTKWELSSRIGESQRYRGTFDTNIADEEKNLAVRVNGSLWTDKPFWLKNGVDWGSGFSISPSFLWTPNDRTKLQLKFSYQYQDMPSYMGIPVFEGQFYSDYDAWFSRDDARQIYEGLLVQASGEVKANSTWTFRGGASMGMSWLNYNAWGLVSSPATYGSVVASGNGSYEFGWADMHYTTYNLYGHAVANFDIGEVANEVLMGLDYTCRVNSGYSGGYGGAGGGGVAVTDSFNVWNPTPPRYGRGSATRTEGDKELHKTGLILQDMLSWESWRLLLGGRMDMHFSDEGNDAFSVSPRIGLTKLVTDKIILFGNFSMTESPNFGYDDEFGKELTDNWKAYQYEAGFRVNPVEDLWFSATAFRIDQEGAPVALGAGANSYYASEGENRSTGVELSLKGAVTEWWDSSISYTYLHYKDVSNGLTFDRFPPHSISVWQTLKVPVGLEESLRVSLGYRFSAKYFATFRGEKITTVPNQQKDYTIPSFNVFDLVLELPIAATDWSPACAVRFGIYNVFDEKYVASSRHAAQCFPGEPRSFEIALKMSF